MKWRMALAAVALAVSTGGLGTAPHESACCFAGGDGQARAAERDAHWAFRRLERPIAPPLVGGEVDERPIDRFLLAAQRRAGVEPVPLADRRTLVRRLYYDLTGLPPTPDQVQAFLDDTAQGAYDRLVDTLLERPEFGEQWGRHWLDVVRYADSNGCSIESNNTYDNAWRYRDYVIAAFNEDTPFDRFVVEQIAGDLLEASSDAQRCRQLIATGFLLLGPKAFGTSGFEPFRLDVIDEQIDTVGKAMLGLSLGCARCHDHKFDPVTTEDYYGLAGIFASTHSVHQEKGWRQGRTWNRVALPGLAPEEVEARQQAYRQRVAAAESGELKKEAEAELQAARAALASRKKAQAPAEQLAEAQRRVERAQRAVRNAGKAKKVLPIVSPVPVAMAVTDREKPVDEQVRYRGQPEDKGPRIRRRVLPLFADGPDDPFAIPADQSGRLELARWLVDPQRGAGHLLARVMVNRIWGHLMGRPLVETVDNFGLTGAQPSHPELLDYLAATWIDEQWSVKRLVRRIVETRTYRLAAVDHPANRRIDPDNRLLWRHQTRRIDAEALRDTLLMLSGTLDRRRGGKTLQHLGLISIASDYLELDTPSPYRRRSVYVPILRDALGFNPQSDEALGLLATFDFADPNLVCGRRTTTTVPAQSLFLMNSPFIIEQSRKIARRLLGDERLSGDAARVDALFLRALGRPADTQERAKAIDYLANFTKRDGSDPRQAAKDRVDGWTSLCQAILGSNEFLFLN